MPYSTKNEFLRMSSALENALIINGFEHFQQSFQHGSEDNIHPNG